MQQIDSCNQSITHLSEEVETLSASLQEKETKIEHLQSFRQVSSTPEQLSKLLKLATQIAELECRLQEAEYQKLQAELEREALLEEAEVMDNFVTLLHVQLGKL